MERKIMLADVPSKPGTYALLLHARSRERMRVGALGIYQIQKGYYLYVGSAFGPGGLRARLSRHTRRRKRLHWHIDYLHPHDKWEEVWFTPSPQKVEHQVSGILTAHPLARCPIPGFGSSDCKCTAHLFYFPEQPAWSKLIPTFDHIDGSGEGWYRVHASHGDGG